MERDQPIAKGMEKVEQRNFDEADEVRDFPKGRLGLLHVGGRAIGRAVLEPGWRWSESVRSVAKSKSCEAPHLQHHAAGVLGVRKDDGTEFECRPGDISLLPPGYDAWVVRNERVVVVDFHGVADYATRK
jgi:hypothetical protein